MDAKDKMGMPIEQIQPLTGLVAIEERQEALITEYVKIEKFPEPIWDMRLKENQIRFKGFLFRIVEELAEAYESYLNQDHTNFFTELSDAIHFCIEAGIVSGYRMPQEDWDKIWSSAPRVSKISLSREVIEPWFWNTTFQFGLLSNVLRGKEWKQTEVMPDLQKFKALFREAYTTLFTGFVTLGCSEQEVWEWYVRKNEVNKFRQRSKY